MLRGRFFVDTVYNDL